MLGERYALGEQLPGRVWQSERGIWIVDADTPALANIAMPHTRSYVCEVGLQSVMLVPLWQAQRVVGTLGVARDPGGPPYTEADFGLLQSMARLDGS